MKLLSTAFEHEGSIPSRYTCDGENINPPLTIEDVPENTKSLVLFVLDPDIPEEFKKDHYQGTWNHWLLWNIDPQTKSIEENAHHLGIEGKNGFAYPGYGGPCPPDKEHRYFFKLFALDIQLDLDDQVSREEIEAAMKDHILEETELMGRYERKQ